MLKLCFDLDDTLYDLSWPFKMAVADLLPQLLSRKYDLNKMYKEYRAYGDNIFDDLQKGKITVDDSGVFRILKISEQYGLNMKYEDAVKFQNTYRNYQKSIFTDPYLFEFLKEYPGDVAILTNGEKEHQLEKAHALQVEEWVDPKKIFVSGALGYRKPDPRAFQSIMAKMNANPEEWIYIGDSYENDMEGAKSVGMKTIQINRHHNKTGPASDYVVYSEKELVKLLNELNKAVC